VEGDARSLFTAVLAGAALFLASCHHLAGHGRVFALSVSPAPPANLAPGTLVKVTARPEPPAEMVWVSGTVKIFGAPVLPFKRDPAGGTWSFKTVVPPLASVPAGSYEIKVWGRTASGEEVSSNLNYEVR
jgi:hypothetical protein